MSIGRRKPDGCPNNLHYSRDGLGQLEPDSCLGMQDLQASVFPSRIANRSERQSRKKPRTSTDATGPFGRHRAM